VHHSDNFDSVFSELIQDPIPFHDSLAKRLAINLWDPAPQFRMLSKRFDTGIETVNNRRRILRGGPLKVVPNGLQVGEGRLGPNYVSH
jgi:hypothetical protein